MIMKSVWCLLLVLCAPLLPAQEHAVSGAPRFLYSGGGSERPYAIDVSSVPFMARRITLSLDGVSRREALAEIGRKSGVQLVYAAGVVPAEGKVRLKAEEITVAAALTEALFGSDVDVVLSPGSTVVLV